MDVNAVAEMEILLLKNRHGPLGEIDAVWIPRNMKIVEAEDYDVDSGTVTEVVEDEEEEDIPY
jgi:hypothetical protein